jgi:hypothetical protein
MKVRRVVKMALERKEKGTDLEAPAMGSARQRGAGRTKVEAADVEKTRKNTEDTVEEGGGGSIDGGEKGRVAERDGRAELTSE